MVMVAVGDSPRAPNANSDATGNEGRDTPNQIIPEFIPVTGRFTEMIHGFRGIA